MCLPALLLRSAKEAENTDRRAWMSGNKGHNSRVCIYEAIVGGAMTIADYFAICVLLVLTLWVTARVYLQSRRF